MPEMPYKWQLLRLILGIFQVQCQDQTFLAMQVAAFCTSLLRLSVPQKRCMKSPVVMISTLVSCAFKMSLKHRPISFLLTVLTATISLNVLGTPSCRQAMYKQALAMASYALPLRFRPSWTILNRELARSVIVFGRLILSHMLEILRNAFIRARSELLTVRWFV